MITGIVRPKSVAEAVRAKTAPGAAYLGGGTWLNSGEAEHVTTLVSLEHLGLDSIVQEPGRCMIGASVTFQELVDSALVPAALRDAARLTASRTLRNMVTLGGELGLLPDDSAVIPALIVLDAEISVAGRRKPLPIESFLDEGETGLVLSVSVSTQAAAAVAAVSRTSHSPRLLVAAVSARAAVPALEQPRFVLSDCRGQRVRLTAAERRLEGAPLPPRQDIEALARAELAPHPDMHASAAYKRYMSGIMIADLLAALAQEAGR
ncbi:MAG: FAD binding domain-containing protein [Spirochaetia bacterium]|jgi:putative selenate reductase FAD-binding subunit